MLARVLSRRCIFLTMILMLSAINGHAVHLTPSLIYTAVTAANEVGDHGVMNKYLLSDHDDNKKAEITDTDDALPSTMSGTSFPDATCPTAPPIFFVWVGSIPKFEHKQNMHDWYFEGHPVILWYHPEGLSEWDMLRMNNDILYSQYPHQPFFKGLLTEVVDKFEGAIARKSYGEYLDADPPLFNGAHFVRKHLSADLRDEPSIYLNEPQETEGNWPPRDGEYKNELPSNYLP